MTFVYTLKDVIGLVALGVGVAGLLLLIVIARIADKLAERRKKREERIEKRLQEKYDKVEPERASDDNETNYCIKRYRKISVAKGVRHH